MCNVHDIRCCQDDPDINTLVLIIQQFLGNMFLTPARRFSFSPKRCQTFRRFCFACPAHGLWLIVPGLDHPPHSKSRKVRLTSVYHGGLIMSLALPNLGSSVGRWWQMYYNIVPWCPMHEGYRASFLPLNHIKSIEWYHLITIQWTIDDTIK